MNVFTPGMNELKSQNNVKVDQIVKARALIAYLVHFQINIFVAPVKKMLSNQVLLFITFIKRLCYIFKTI